MSGLRKKEESETSSSCRSVLVSIQAELDATPTFSQISERRCCIYRVPQMIRRVNEEAYTPVAVSIGPFHDKNERLLPMNTHKLMYLHSFINNSKTNADLNTYIEIIKGKESQIRECYAEDIHMSHDEFVRMFLIDSIFVIELLRTENVVMPFTDGQLLHDLMLEENQLPFFILKDLYSAAFKQHDDDDDDDVHMSSTCTVSLTHLACEFFSVDKSRVEVDPITHEAEACCHLLDLLRCHYLPSQRKTDNVHKEERQQWITNIKACCCHLLDLLRSLYLLSHPKTEHHVDLVKRIFLCPTAMSLYEAGVKFRVSDEPCSLLDIHFDKDRGILTIPKLLVDDDTECSFRNLMAFEQCHYRRTYLADYHDFLDCLINTKEDVQLLANAGIIDNWLGSDKEVSCLINSLGSNITSSAYYASITEQLHDHCNKRWNRYRATLKHTYFKHPWAVLSVIYAVILLLLTIAQLLTGILAVPGVLK